MLSFRMFFRTPNCNQIPRFYLPFNRLLHVASSHFNHGPSSGSREGLRSIAAEMVVSEKTSERYAGHLLEAALAAHESEQRALQREVRVHEREIQAHEKIKALMKDNYTAATGVLEKELLCERGKFNIRGILEFIGKWHAPKRHSTQAQLDEIASQQTFRDIFSKLCDERQVGKSEAMKIRANLYRDFSEVSYFGNEEKIIIDATEDGLGPLVAVVVEAYFRFHGKKYHLITEDGFTSVGYRESDDASDGILES